MTAMKLEKHVRKRKMFLLLVIKKRNCKLRMLNKKIPRRTPIILLGPTRISSKRGKGRGNGGGGGGGGLDGFGGRMGVETLTMKIK